LPESLDSGQFSVRRDQKQTFYRFVEVAYAEATLIRLRQQAVDRVTTKIQHASESDVNLVRPPKQGEQNDGGFATPG
jgi:hypothetical protein